jgi:hypothetical protein
MTYLDDLADEIRARLPDGTIPSYSDSDGLFALYALLLPVKGAAVSSRDVHNAWSAWMRN